MRFFTKPTGIDRLSLEARIIYTGFCLFLLVGFATSVWFYHDDQLGLRPQQARVYYLGSSAAAAASTAASGAPMHFAKPPRQVMETFHFHLFSVSVCLLIIAHLFMMCRLRRAVKLGVIVLANVATLAHLLAPPLIRLASPHAAWLMFPSALLMGLTWLLMIVWPLGAMWRGPIAQLVGGHRRRRSAAA